MAWQGAALWLMKLVLWAGFRCEIFPVAVQTKPSVHCCVCVCIIIILVVMIVTGSISSLILLAMEILAMCLCLNETRAFLSVNVNGSGCVCVSECARPGGKRLPTLIVGTLCKDAGQPGDGYTL